MVIVRKVIILALVPILLLTIVSCSAKGDDNGAKKPSLMYKGTLFSISPDKIDTYKFKSEEELEYTDTIKEAVDGTKLAQKDMQVSGNADLVGCKVYISKLYPKYVFVLDRTGEYVAFVEVDNIE